MPTILELDISEKDLPRHLKGGTAVRVTEIGSDGQLHGPPYCDGGQWQVIRIEPITGNPSMRTVIFQCGLCDAHIQRDIPSSSHPSQPLPSVS